MRTKDLLKVQKGSSIVVGSDFFNVESDNEQKQFRRTIENSLVVFWSKLMIPF